MGKPLVQIGDLVGRCGLSVIFLAMFMGCAVPQTHAGAENRLFMPAVDGRATIDEAMRGRILRHRFVNVNLRLLARSQEAQKAPTAARGAVVLNLFDDAVFPAVLDRRESRSADSFTWLGRIDGVQSSQVTLVVDNGVISGNIRVDHSFYQIRYAGEGTHVIYQVDPNAFPDEGKPLPVPGPRN
jgi:hypothetical protein